jgi:ketosteroid isomerase-like protein
MPEDTTMPAEREDIEAIQEVLTRIGRAWKLKDFAGLDNCFDDDAVITGPDYVVYGKGRPACANSYREFALNAHVLAYSEAEYQLRVWGDVAVCTFAWEMTYERDLGPKSEKGTDQLVLARRSGTWRVVFRHIFFAPSSQTP